MDCIAAAAMNGHREDIWFLPETRPWLPAAFLASGVVVVWGVLSVWLSAPAGRAPSRFAFPFTLLEPLSAPARAAVQGAAVTYWALGLLFARRALLGAAWTRAYIARALVTGGIGLLGFVLPLLAVIWTLAAMMGVIPDGPWGASEGNHGPWRHVPDLRRILSEALALPAYAMLLGRISVMLHSSRAGWHLIGASVLVLMALIGTHYWLID
jgi:hypothetical protein